MSEIDDELGALLEIVFSKEDELEPRVEVSLSLLLNGYTIDELVDDLSDYDIDTYLSVLLAAGANPDKLVSRLGDEDLVKHLDELLNAGAKIDIDSLIAKLDHGYIVGHLAELLAAGANPDKLAARLDAKDIAYNLNKLREAGAKIDVDRLAGQLTPRPIADNLDELRAAGAVIDVNLLASQLFRRNVLRRMPDRRRLGKYVEKFLSAGMDPERLICILNDSGMRYWLKNGTIELLATATGVDSDEIRARLHR